METNITDEGFIFLFVDGCLPKIRKDLFLDFPGPLVELKQKVKTYSDFQKYEEQFQIQHNGGKSKIIPKQRKRTRRHIECWNCKQDHYAMNCPLKQGNTKDVGIFKGLKSKYYFSKAVND